MIVQNLQLFQCDRCGQGSIRPVSDDSVLNNALEMYEFIDKEEEIEIDSEKIDNTPLEIASAITLIFPVLYRTVTEDPTTICKTLDLRTLTLCGECYKELQDKYEDFIQESIQLLEEFSQPIERENKIDSNLKI